MPSNSRDKYWITAGVVGLAIVAIKYRGRILRNIKNVFIKDLCAKQKVEVINTGTECQQILEKLSRACKESKVLGFDCEWVTTNGRRHPVALLQLASHDGFCALFRLSKMKQVPLALKEILEDSSILKVGVAPSDDARYLSQDYYAFVNGTLDLRYLADACGETPEGLSAMSLKHLNVKLDKDWRVRCSDWEATELSERQIKYAATDAFVAVELFHKFTDKLLREKYSNANLKSSLEMWKCILEECQSFIDMRYKYKHYNNNAASKSESLQTPFDKLISDEQRRNMNMPNFKQPKKGYVTRSKPLYENCYMQNPKGQILSTCDMKKAKWYLEKGLATHISDDPLTIRLNFQPSGDVAGDVDKYYQIPRENRCVVCGHDDFYIRKNVIPREYRKLFPVVMKSHSSHDVLLLCNNCHQISNVRDMVLRGKLSVICDAPLDSSHAVVLHKNLQKVASAAKALLEGTKEHNIPAKRREELEAVVKEHFQTEDISEEMLRDAYRLKYVKENPSYESHGKKVVDYFSAIPGGLLQLEEMWRQHFLDTMKPKYMPELWSLQHNKERLEIRAEEGRLKPEIIKLSGFLTEEGQDLVNST